MNTADFLKNLASTAGFTDTEFSHAVLAHPELLKVELPDPFIAAFNGKYLTEEAAKANSNIKNYFYPLALDPIDNSLKSLMAELEFSDADKDEVNKEKSTYKKNEMVIKKLKTMSSKSTSDEDKAKFNAEIKKLNGELVKKDAEKEAALKEINTGWISKLSNQTLTSKIKSQPLYTTDALDIEDVTTLAHNKLKKALQEKKADTIFDPESLTYKLVQKDNPDLAYFEGGKEVTFDAFLQKTLADAKLLKTTAAQTPTGDKPKFVTPVRTDGETKNPNQSRIKSSAEEDIANLTAANA